MMKPRSIAILIFYIATLLVTAPAKSSPVSIDTCLSGLSAAPHNFQKLYLLGDSITSTLEFEDNVSAAGATKGIFFNGKVTTPGIKVGAMLKFIKKHGATRQKIADSDLVYTNLSINNSWIALSNETRMREDIDNFINELKAINPDIFILWHEPYAYPPLVKYPQLSSGGSLVAGYLREKDAAGEICLIPWADLAEADPRAYTDSRHPDGVHVTGTEDLYLEPFKDYLFALVGNGTPEETGNAEELPEPTDLTETTERKHIFGGATVVGNAVSFPNDGNRWKTFDMDSHSNVCLSWRQGLVCQLDPGRYAVINVTTNQRQQIVIDEAAQGPSPSGASPAPSEIEIPNNPATVPSDTTGENSAVEPPTNGEDETDVSVNPGEDEPEDEPTETEGASENPADPESTVPNDMALNDNFVIHLIGQRNAAGRERISDIYANQSGMALPNRELLTISNSPNDRPHMLGPDMGLANYWPGTGEVVLIKTVFSNSKIAHWNKWIWSKHLANYKKAYIPDNARHIVVWIDGENDAKSLNPATYKQQQELLMSKIKESIPDPTVINVLLNDQQLWNGIYPSRNTNAAEINDAKTELAAANPNIFSIGGSYPLGIDNLHYNADAFGLLSDDIINIVFSEPEEQKDDVVEGDGSAPESESETTETTSNPGGNYIFHFLGQSNAVGTVAGPLPYTNDTGARYPDGALVADATRAGVFGVEVILADIWEQPEEVVIVKTATGGVAIQRWLEVYWPQHLQKLQQLANQFDDYQHVVLWVQGESDAYDNYSARYEYGAVTDELFSLFAQHMPGVRIIDVLLNEAEIFGGPPNHRALGAAVVNNAKRQISESRNDTIFIGGNYELRPDQLHYNHEGLLQMATEFVDAVHSPVQLFNE